MSIKKHVYSPTQSRSRRNKGSFSASIYYSSSSNSKKYKRKNKTIRKKGDERRHKKWCIYFDDNFCTIKKCDCIGSRFCKKYKTENNNEK